MLAYMQQPCVTGSLKPRPRYYLIAVEKNHLRDKITRLGYATGNAI